MCPPAMKAGTAQATIDALREGRRPGDDGADEESLATDFTTELLRTH